MCCDVLHVLKVSSLSYTLLIVLRLGFECFELFHMQIDLILVEIRLLFQIFYLFLKFLNFLIFLLFDHFYLLLILLVSFIQQLRDIDFRHSRLFLFHENIFNQVCSFIFQPVHFGFLIILTLENVLVIFEAILE